MLRFLTNRKLELEARALIGTELHRQIKHALDQDEHGASARLQTPFCVGYLFYFVRMGFSQITGKPGKRAADKHFRFICDGILPNKLYDVEYHPILTQYFH